MLTASGFGMCGVKGVWELPVVRGPCTSLSVFVYDMGAITRVTLRNDQVKCTGGSWSLSCQEMAAQYDTEQEDN